MRHSANGRGTDPIQGIAEQRFRELDRDGSGQVRRARARGASWGRAARARVPGVTRQVALPLHPLRSTRLTPYAQSSTHPAHAAHHAHPTHPTRSHPAPTQVSFLEFLFCLESWVEDAEEEREKA